MMLESNAMKLITVKAIHVLQGLFVRMRMVHSPVSAKTQTWLAIHIPLAAKRPLNAKSTTTVQNRRNVFTKMECRNVETRAKT